MHSTKDLIQHRVISTRPLWSGIAQQSGCHVCVGLSSDILGQCYFVDHTCVCLFVGHRCAHEEHDWCCLSLISSNVPSLLIIRLLFSDLDIIDKNSITSIWMTSLLQWGSPVKYSTHSSYCTVCQNVHQLVLSSTDLAHVVE